MFQSVKISYPRNATIAASICAIMFCIIGVLGNLVTIVALLRCPKLRAHATTFFVLSLSLSDLLFCGVNLPLTASRYINEAWILGDGTCKLFPVLFYGNVAVSLLNMVAITLNRYIRISYNQYYNFLYKNKSIWCQLISTWIFAFLIMLPPLLGIWGQLGLNPSTFSCTILAKDNHSPKKTIFLIGFVLPCVVIILSYSCIFWKIRRSRIRLQVYMKPAISSGNRVTRKEHKDRRLTQLMLLIFVCFLLCFLPLMTVNVFDDEMQYPILHVVASILAWASSVINPFIYAATNRQYRTAYNNLFNSILKHAKYVLNLSDQNPRQQSSLSTNRHQSVLMPPLIPSQPSPTSTSQNTNYSINSPLCRIRADQNNYNMITII